MTALAELPIMLLSYFISSLAVFSFLKRIFKDDESSSVRVFVMSSGMGPLFISWMLSVLFRLLPGHGDAFYITFIAVVMILILALSGAEPFKLLHRLFERGVDCFKGAFRDKWFELSVLALAGMLLLILFALSAFLPVSENDALMYVSYARHIYGYKDMACYPFTSPDPFSGLHSIGSHPPAYHLLIVWACLLKGSAAEPGAAKLISPLFSLFTVMMLFAAPWRPGSRLSHAASASLILLSTPIYFIQASDQSIDPLRMYTYSLSFLLLWEFIRSRSSLALSLLSLSVAFGLYSHQLGFFALPFILFFLIAISGLPWRLKVKSSLAVLVASVLLGSVQYISNFMMSGFPFTPVDPLFKVAGLDFSRYFAESRDMHGLLDRVVLGWLQCLTKPVPFGVSFWLALAAGIGICRSWLLRKSLLPWSFEAICLVGVLMFQAFMLAPLAMKDDLNLAHSRYFMTALPLASCLAAYALSWLCGKSSGRKSLIFAALAMICLPALVYSAIRVSWFPGAFNSPSASSLEIIKSSPLGKFRLLSHFVENVPKDELAITFRSSDFACYSGRRMLYESDPSLFGFYGCKEKDEAYGILRSLGVKHILVPSHQMPTVTGTEMMDILADPSLSSLIFSSSFNRHFSIGETGAVEICSNALPGIALPSGGDALMKIDTKECRGGVGRLELFAEGSGEFKLSADGGAVLWKGLLDAAPRRIAFQFDISMLMETGGIRVSSSEGSGVKLYGIRMTEYDAVPTAIFDKEPSGIGSAVMGILRSRPFSIFMPSGWVM